MLMRRGVILATATLPGLALWAALPAAPPRPAFEAPGFAGASLAQPADDADPQPASAPGEDDEPQEVEVYLDDGQTFTGVLLEERPDALVVEVAGISVTFPRVQIRKYTKLESVETRYLRMRESMGQDVDRLLVLVDWLRERERFDLAQAELHRILELDPGNAEALQQVRLIDQLRKLREASKAPKGPGDGGEDEDEGGEDPGAGRDRFPLLSPDEINLIKVYEVDVRDPPRMVISRDTIERLLEANIGNPLVPTTREGREAYFRKRPEQILDLMFRLRAREFYSEVKVDPLDQPRSMRLFRDEVHATWLINACATTACHGGEEAGRLRLYPRRSRSDRSVYTNFIILDRFRLADGAALLNYEDPARSPLLQVGLPREDSLFPHPEVLRGVADREAWRPLFRSADDRRYRRTVEWLESMYRPRPEYPVEYDPPGASEPARTEDDQGAGGGEPIER